MKEEMKAKLNTQVKIAKRFDILCVKNSIPKDDRMTTIMDLDCAGREFNIDFEELLEADEFNFAHDMLGIKRHIDRSGNGGFGAFKNCFVPRFARAIKETK